MSDKSDDETPEKAANPVGRPTEYRPEFCQSVANLCIGVATDFEVLNLLEVSVRTHLIRWKA